MSIYAISDLHLSYNTDKPMDIFGWKNYENKIKENWNSKVKESDLVILGGDFSWSMDLKDTYKDFEFIHKLPGKKILIKGNHDYWWGTLKPMDIFGWKNYENKIKENWNSKVKESDLVILGGDFSWSMDLKDTYKDFEFIHKLPGKKILIKGNHDYWWGTLTKMKKYINEIGFNDINFLYNNSYEFEGKIICGTRGWNFTDLHLMI